MWAAHNFGAACTAEGHLALDVRHILRAHRLVGSTHNLALAGSTADGWRQYGGGEGCQQQRQPDRPHAWGPCVHYKAAAAMHKRRKFGAGH